MILTNDAALAKKINSAVFPGMQGGPLMHIIAAKAVAFGEALRPDFKVYARDYQNALVLYKPLAYTRGVSGKTTNDTATTHALGGNYRSVQADGSLGPVITSITLRNGEGAVLLKA